MDASQTPNTPEDLAAVTRDISIALDQWYASRKISLPVETRAEFSAMALEAVLRNPERDRHEVMDDLLAELDGMLADILDEREDHPVERASPPSPPPQARGRVQGWLQRIRDRLH